MDYFNDYANACLDTDNYLIKSGWRLPDIYNLSMTEFDLYTSYMQREYKRSEFEMFDAFIYANSTEDNVKSYVEMRKRLTDSLARNPENL